MRTDMDPSTTPAQQAVAPNHLFCSESVPDSSTMPPLKLRFMIAVLTTALLALAGMWLVMCGIFSPRAANDFASGFALQLAVGFVGILIVAFLSPASRILAIRSSFALGGFYSCRLFIFGSAVGLVSVIPAVKDWSLESYFIKPMFNLSLFGLIPAFLVGLIGTLMVRLLVPAPKPAEQGAAG